MSDAPKIVLDRLRAAAPREAHPDADVLTAFAEQALSGAEREGVVRHLARCVDCREVVALSLPPSVETATKPEAIAGPAPTRQPADRFRWFAWPTLRWAALAASVVVVASVLILQPGKQSDSASGTKKLAAQGQTQPPVSEVASLDATTSAQFKQAPASTPADRMGDAPVRATRAARLSEPTMGGMQTAVGAPPARLADGKRLDSLQDKGNLSLSAGNLASQPAAAPARGANVEAAPAVTAQGETSSKELVAVEGAAAEMQTTAVQGNIGARNEAPAPPVEKAKAALKERERDETESKSQLADKAPQKLAAGYAKSDSLASEQRQIKKQASAAAVPHWMLGQGKLQRSLDEGKTWQTTPQLDGYVLTFDVLDREVWAGSRGGKIFHSTDTGATWTTLQPATKNATLTADIVTIKIRSHSEIVLATGNGETWATTDAGKSWDKK